MDRDQFFASLTDEAAIPNSKFINDLRNQVQKVAAGGKPPSKGMSNWLKNPVVIGIITSSVLFGGVAWSSVGGSEPVVVQDPIVETQKPVQSDPVVLASTDQKDDEPQEDSQVDEPVQVAQNTDENTSQQPVESQVSDDTSTGDDSVAEDTVKQVIPVPGVDASLDLLWDVEVWNLISFKHTPEIQDKTADVVIDQTALDFDWGAGSPNAIINTDEFAIRATHISELEQGDYQMTISADDGVRVYVDGSLVFDRWSYGAGVDVFTFQTGLAGTVETTIVVEYYDDDKEAFLSVEVEKL